MDCSVINNHISACKNELDDFLDNKSLGDIPAYIEAYKNHIRDFFRASGAGNLIRELYSKVEDPEVYAKNCSNINIEDGYDKFMNNLFPGMDGYINDTVSKGNINDNVAQTLNSSLSNICGFIESIFGGDKNPMGEYPCGKTMKKLKYLIDFITKMDILENKAKRLDAVLKSREMDSTVSAARELYSKAIAYFIYNYVTSTFKNVASVCGAISPEPKAVIADPGPVVDKPFKLFV